MHWRQSLHSDLSSLTITAVYMQLIREISFTYTLQHYSFPLVGILSWEVESQLDGNWLKSALTIGHNLAPADHFAETIAQMKASHLQNLFSEQTNLHHWFCQLSNKVAGLAVFTIIGSIHLEKSYNHYDSFREISSEAPYPYLIWLTYFIFFYQHWLARHPKERVSFVHLGIPLILERLPPGRLPRKRV